MLHHLTLPFRPPPPLHVPSDHGFTRCQSYSSSLPVSPCSRPSSSFSHALPSAAEAEHSAAPAFQSDLDKENSGSRSFKPRGWSAGGEERGVLARAAESVGSASKLSSVQDAALLPQRHFLLPPEWRHAPADRVSSPGSARYHQDTPPEQLSPDSDRFLAMIDENLQLGHKKGAFPLASRPTRTRSASSDYNIPGSPRVVSPASTIRVNKLSLSDLSRFGRGNDRLSFLRSSSTVSSIPDDKGNTNHHEAIHEATVAISGWQDEPRSLKRPAYNLYELANSSEVLPSDSLSQRASPPPLELEPLTRVIGRQISPSGISGSTSDRMQRLKNQYDGPADSQRPKASLPCTRPKKRSSSNLSFRSLCRSLSKRLRLQELRKLATQAYRGGSRRFVLARHRWKLQREQERRQFEAWKANRRRERPADPLKGIPERGFGTFSFERTRYGNEEWWKEGVAKYQVPRWLFRDECGLQSGSHGDTIRGARIED